MTAAATLQKNSNAGGDLKHTPYDGSHPAFTIGLQPLDLEDWIEVDDRLDVYLAEKGRLEDLYPGKTFMAEPETDAAQAEVLHLLFSHLFERHPDVYRRTGDLVQVNGRPVELNGAAPPLQTAGRLVQEDLLLMRRDESGWRLVAGSLSFPSSWSLAEKFSLPIDEIHAPVPGFGPGTRNAAVINRVFDNLRVELPVWRMNWSLYPDDTLFHDHHTAPLLARADTDPVMFFRVEYQTLRKLPTSGDILFTVRIHLDPISLLERHPDRKAICKNFAAMLEALDNDQLEYKKLTTQRDDLLRRLRILSDAEFSNRVVS